MALVQLRTIEQDDLGIRFDLSGVGTAVVSLPHAQLNVPSLTDIQTEVERCVFSSLPKHGCAVSVVIPIYNEAEVLPTLVQQVVSAFSDLPFTTELLLCENGSKDNTRDIARSLVDKHPNLRLVTIQEASYGRAIRHGIEEAHADIVIVFNADLWSRRFLLDSILLLQAGYDIVIGSKRLVRSHDKRPLLRRLITASFNLFLRFAFGFAGTDTHGMKAVRRSRVLRALSECYTQKEVFDTELVLKAQVSGLSISEVPTEVEDLRPARLSLMKRVPSTVKDLVIIAATLRNSRRTIAKQT